MSFDFEITVALLTRNRCAQGYLKEALDAILAQTHTDFELLVVDNFSADSTSEFIRTYSDPRLTYIRQPPGGNATNSYIRSTVMARGKYILIAHDDDIMETIMIERQLEFMREHPDCLMVATNVSLIDESGTEIQKRLYSLDEDVIFNRIDYISRYFSDKLWLPAPTHLYKRDSYLRILKNHLGTRSPAYLPGGDLWVPFTLNLQGEIGFIAHPLLRYRQHNNQESKNVDQGYPVIQAIELFANQNLRNRYLRPHLQHINAFLTRFKAQVACFEYTKKEQLVKELALLYERWVIKKNDNNKIDAILPLEILLHLLGIIATSKIDQIHPQNEAFTKGSGGRQGFRCWLKAIQQGSNIFDTVRNEIKIIAIHGSMLNAYLIKESADQAGVKVDCCFDSSPARIGKTVFDIPILSISDISREAGKIDAIILSGEHDQEDAISTIINSHLAGTANIPQIISWKQLAHNSSLPTHSSKVDDG